MDSKVALKLRVTFSTCSQKALKKKKTGLDVFGSIILVRRRRLRCRLGDAFFGAAILNSFFLCVLFSVYLRFVSATNGPRRLLRQRGQEEEEAFLKFAAQLKGSNSAAVSKNAALISHYGWLLSNNT